ncbi:MAG: BrnT family toxin [Nitrospirota bacterium]|nr:BrnT family toxin [Nitrospirota bacterium]
MNDVSCFEWDVIKARSNRVKHGVTFGQSATVFHNAATLSVIDLENSSEEERWITLGPDRSGRLLVVCHTYIEVSKTESRIRIISARKATKNESREYERQCS